MVELNMADLVDEDVGGNLSTVQNESSNQEKKDHRL
jgi:hypothetical protein